MGMFDNILCPDAKCKNCGEELKDLQSKDGPCYMKLLNYWEVDNFYGDCRKCGYWNEFDLKVGRSKIPLYDYEQTCKKIERI